MLYRCATAAEPTNKLNTDLISSERPGSEFHDAGLLIEGKVGDVNGARTLEGKKKSTLRF